MNSFCILDGKGNKHRKRKQWPCIFLITIHKASSLVPIHSLRRPLSIEGLNAFNRHNYYLNKNNIIRKTRNSYLKSSVTFDNPDRISRNSNDTSISNHLEDAMDYPTISYGNEDIETRNASPSELESKEQMALLLLEEHDVQDLVLEVLSSNESISTELNRVIDQTPDIPNSNIDTDAYKVPYSKSDIRAAVPGVAAIIRFVLAAIGVWLCSPILSMIDTSAVGLLSGTQQQAALNPAVSITEYSALMMAFIFTGTTNLIAAAQESDRGTNGESRHTASTFKASLQLSFFVGTVMCIGLMASSRTLLSLIMGRNTVADPVIVDAALKYIRIRAIGMPAAAVIGSAQSACLGMKDTRSPLIILASAAIINLVADFLLVGKESAWIGGAAGASWATVLSQYTALFMFVSWLRNERFSFFSKASPWLRRSVERVRSKNGKRGTTPSFKNKFRVKSLVSVGKVLSNRVKFMKYARRSSPSPLFSSVAENNSVVAASDVKNTKSSTPENNSVVSVSDVISTKGLLSGMKKSDLVKMPNLNIARKFVPYFLPVTSTSLGRVSSYVAMSHVISSAMGTSAMAAQQILISFFYCLTPIADSFSLTAQSFVPTLVQRSMNEPKNGEKALADLAFVMMKAAVLFTALSVSTVAIMPLISRFFTSDVTVIKQVNSIVPYLSMFFLVHPITLLFEGILLGRKDLGFLGKSYAAYFFIVPWIFLRMKEASLSGFKAVTLESVWQVFVLYQLSRFVFWSLRFIQQTKKALKEAKLKEEALIFG